MSIKESIYEIMEYLNDEENHFWENCSCSDEVKNRQFEHLCTCEENQNHIWRKRQEVKEWLESPFCPLVDDDELEELDNEQK